MRQRTFVLAMLSLLLAGILGVEAAASPRTGQSYDTFFRYYQENISFINNNDNRHLLPLALAKSMDSAESNRIHYSLIGDTLHAEITTDEDGSTIANCRITLTAPTGMEYGNIIYNDFAISGYQSYALLMAMHTEADPVRRYALVTDVVAGMAEGNGEYRRQLGVYTLSCTRVDNVAELFFQKNQAESGEETMEEGPPPDMDIEAGLL
ncbi:MAG: hypothetical protein FWF86_07345 [Clostridia bacterium]|nr:hypothetical protein [Clostridia bacterium]